jgi:hypothetical protein
MLTGIPANNRLAFCFLFIQSKIHRKTLVLIPVLIITIVYFIASLFLPAFDQSLYFAYVLSIMTFFFSFGFAVKRHLEVTKILRLLLLINLGYALFQTFLLNNNFDDLTMIHSNDPYQAATNYVPHHFFGILYRVTGLFNESSPFVFFLTIMFTFEAEIRKSILNIPMLLLLCGILLSGAKISMLFLLIYGLIKGNRFVKALVILCGTAVVYAFLANPILFGLIFLGRHGSIYKRIREFEETAGQGFTLMGTGLKSSSSGQVALDFLSIVGTGFGVFGILIFLTSFFLFFMSLRKSCGVAFFASFLCGLFASGSLLIVQYLMFFLCLGALYGKNKSQVL